MYRSFLNTYQLPWHLGWKRYCFVSLPLHLPSPNSTLQPSGRVSEVMRKMLFSRGKLLLLSKYRPRASTIPPGGESYRSPFANLTFEPAGDPPDKFAIWKDKKAGGPHDIDKTNVETLVSHPACMLVAFGVTFVLKIMLQHAHVNLSEDQRHFCVEEAILNNTPQLITLLASK